MSIICDCSCLSFDWDPYFSLINVRLKKSMSEGENLKEAQAINKSLSALGDVISALATEQQVRLLWLDFPLSLTLT